MLNRAIETAVQLLNAGYFTDSDDSPVPGVELLGSGLYRRVYRFGDFVFKYGSQRANRNEQDVWTQAISTPAKALLSPTYYLHEAGKLLVAKYAGPSANDEMRDGKTDRDAVRKAREHLEDALTDAGFNPLDLHPGNHTMAPLAFDYGEFDRC